MAEPAAPTADDKSPQKVRDMFARVAPAYDLLNHLLSGSLDRLWRRRAAQRWRRHAEDGPVLDLCCGTGDQAIALRRQGALVTAADFCVPMLVFARRKFGALAAPVPATLAADAMSLPFPAGRFSAVTVSFGLRNVADLDATLTEMRRVLRPGGAVLILEFALPRQPVLRQLYLFYFRHILPRIGALVSRHQSAYAYLPSSVEGFPQRDELTARMSAAGFTDSRWQDFSAGTVCLYTARRER